MTDPLITYLHDHLAGSNFAVELVKHLHDQHAPEDLGQFAAALLIEIENDRTALQQLVAHAGEEPSKVKEAVAWIGEKMSQLKLSYAASGAAGSFQALEALALGIQGKFALWQALAVVAPSDPRLQGADLATLSSRAQAQHARVEAWRLRVAAVALRPNPQ